MTARKRTCHGYKRPARKPGKKRRGGSGNRSERDRSVPATLLPWNQLIHRAPSVDPADALDRLLDLLDDPATDEQTKATIRDWLDS